MAIEKWNRGIIIIISKNLPMQWYYYTAVIEKVNSQHPYSKLEHIKQKHHTIKSINNTKHLSR